MKTFQMINLRLKYKYQFEQQLKHEFKHEFKHQPVILKSVNKLSSKDNKVNKPSKT
jgi:hypothetical protein